MKASGERYFPRVENVAFAPFEPFISYEHWHRYCYALPFVAGKTVLDIASGEGYGSAFLAAHADSVYGVDISAEAIAHARVSYVRDNLHYLQGAADAIPIPGQHCFDVIVSFETIEHLDATTQERFASEIRRLLKPDGVLLISTPNRATYSEDGLQRNPYHFHEFTRDEFVAFLQRSFAHVRILSQHVYPVSYIWSPEGPEGPLAEYQLHLDDGVFRPGAGDAKEIGYLIAVCAQLGEQAAGSDSLLLDLSEVAFRGIPRLERWQTSSLFFDTGAGFRPEEVVREETEYIPEFTLEFALDPTAAVRQLRWDPLEMRLCRVRLREVLWQDVNGLITRLDLGRVTSNGRQRDVGAFEFETLDPMIFLPISGPVTRVTIIGACEAKDVPATMVGLEQAVQSRILALAGRDSDLQAARHQIAEREQSIEAYRARLAGRDSDLQAARHQIAEREQSIEAYRARLVHLDDELRTMWQHLTGYRSQISRLDDVFRTTWQQLAARENSIVDLDEELRERGRRVERCEHRIQELEWALVQRETLLQSMLQSKRWTVINAIRSTLYFLPGLLARAWRRGGDDRPPAVVAPSERPIADRAPHRHSRSGRKSLT
jgi:SAM-dependent methyltransferase/predicted  nucleic acid-binding Zn-ribbon protein